MRSDTRSPNLILNHLLSNIFVHTENGESFRFKDTLQCTVQNNSTFISGILETMATDVLPHLCNHLQMPTTVVGCIYI
jgi:hypothetical protein